MGYLPQPCVGWRAKSVGRNGVLNKGVSPRRTQVSRRTKHCLRLMQAPLGEHQLGDLLQRKRQRRSVPVKWQRTRLCASEGEGRTRMGHLVKIVQDTLAGFETSSEDLNRFGALLEAFKTSWTL